MRTICSTLAVLLLAQKGLTQASSSLLKPLTSASAANSWQFAPIDLTKQKDTVPSDIRVRRTNYFATLLVPLLRTTDGLSGSASFPGSYTSEPADVSGEPSSVWLVAAFRDFAVFPVGAHGAYTEVHLRVKQVIANRSTARILPGNRIDLVFSGGELIESNKQIRRFLVTPERYFLKPGGTYLLDLRYSPAERSYLMSKRWIIADDVLMPDTAEDVVRSSAGKSSLAGLSINQATFLIRKTLAASK